MPLILHQKINSNTSVGVWKSEEDNSFFLDHLKLSSKESDHIIELKPRRQKEWLSTRFLCNLMTDRYGNNIIKDEYGKPYLQNSDHYISISHSSDMSAVIISDIPVGIDIQKHVEKIYRIQQKFISEEEHVKIDQKNHLDHYHIFWGAKEAMYKAYGRKELDFKKHIHLYPFKYFAENLELKGYVKKDNIEMPFFVYTKKIDNYYLIYSILDS